MFHPGGDLVPAGMNLRLSKVASMYFNFEFGLGQRKQNLQPAVNEAITKKDTAVREKYEWLIKYWILALFGIVLTLLSVFVSTGIKLLDVPKAYIMISCIVVGTSAAIIAAFLFNILLKGDK